MKIYKSISGKRILSTAGSSQQEPNHQAIANQEQKNRICHIDCNSISKLTRTPSKRVYKVDNFMGQPRPKTTGNGNRNGKRVKTEGDLRSKVVSYAQLYQSFVEEPSKTTLYHPIIYHKPQARRKYFCSIVDSYLASTTQLNDTINQKYQIINGNAQSKMGNYSKSNSRIIRNDRRAETAGLRKLVSENVSYNCNAVVENQKIQQKEYKYTPSKINQSCLKKLKVKQKLISNTTYAGRSSPIRVRSPYKSQYTQYISQNISFENTSFEEENQNYATFFSAEPIQIEQKSKSKSPNNYSSTATLKKQTQNSLIYRQVEYSEQITDKLLQEIKDRLKLEHITIDSDKKNAKITLQQDLYRIIVLKTNSSSSLQKYFGKKIKIKQFRKDFKSKHIANMIQKVNQFKVSTIWKSLPRLKTKNFTQSELFYSLNVKSLREQFFKFKINQKTDKGTVSYIIQPSQSYHKIFQNNCEYFRGIIVSLAEDLMKMKGNVINNNLSLDNVYRLEEKCFKIGDWGCSAVQRRLLVAGEKTVFKDEPTLKREISDNQDKAKHFEWLIEPECLPPEIIQCLLQGNYGSIWRIQDCPQIWSLGIIIFQLLTAVPVWMPYPAAMGHQVPRPGYCYDKMKRLQCIYEMQSKMPNVVVRWLRDQKNSIFYNKIHPQILNLMKQMLQINPKLRPRPEEIVYKLKNC